MKILLFLTALLLLLSGQPIGRYSINAASALKPSASQSTYRPVYMARLKGKKLIVTGQNFDEGAVILINGEMAETIHDADSPTTRLIARKAGKMIPLDSVYRVSVRNSDGVEYFITYFRGSSFNARVLQSLVTDPRQSEPNGTGVYAEVGDYLLTTELTSGANTMFVDHVYLKKVTDMTLPSAQYQLYRTRRPGITTFYVAFLGGGDYPPFVYYEVQIRIR